MSRASGQIWKCPWTLKSMLLSSVPALVYPKQCMTPGFMCLLFIIYFVHGLEIPSENFLYHSLQSLLMDIPRVDVQPGFLPLVIF